MPTVRNPCAQSEDVSSILTVASTYDVYYHNDKPVEIVSRPRASKVNVLFIRDVETRMCYLVPAYQVVYRPNDR